MPGSSGKTKKELMAELEAARQRIAELERRSGSGAAEGVPGECEARLRTITDNIPGMVFQYLLRPDGSYAIPFVSNKFQDITGIPVEKLQADPSLFFSRFFPEDLPAIQDAVAASAENLTPFRVEHRLSAHDGDVRWFRVESTPRRLPDGSVLWDGVSVDVTERRRAEEKLWESEERFKSMFEGVPDGIFLADASTGEIAMVNRAAERMTGKDRSRLVGMHQSRLHPARFAEKSRVLFREHRRLLDREEFPPFLEHVVAGADGGEIPVEIHARMVELGGEKFIMGVFRDNTERRRVQEALRESEGRYRQVVDTMAETLSVIEPDGTFLFANARAAKNLSGGGPDRVVGRNIRDFVPPDQASALVDRYREVAERGEALVQEVKVAMQGGGGVVPQHAPAHQLRQGQYPGRAVHVLGHHRA